jgi:putative ABC transport system substrate-binding protein
MRRREFITLLGGAAVAWPLAARAQEPAMPLVGFLDAGLPETRAYLLAAVRQGLAESGFVEGRNVAIDYRSAEGQFDRLPALAAELVRRRVTVIITPGSAVSTGAAKAATTTIPIVFSTGGDPVQLGLVASLNRPGGNVTGFTEMNSELAPKRLGLLHELIPDAARFAILVDPNFISTSPTAITDVQAAASAIGRQIEVLYAAGTIRDIDTAFASLVQKRVDALLVNPSARFYGLRAQLANVAALHAVPAIYWDRAFAEAGGLMSYGSNVTDLFRQVGVYAGRILKGEKPADLPVQQATKFELIINLKAAKAIRLTIPESLLLRADEAIE